MSLSNDSRTKVGALSVIPPPLPPDQKKAPVAAPTDSGGSSHNQRYDDFNTSEPHDASPDWREEKDPVGQDTDAYAMPEAVSRQPDKAPSSTQSKRGYAKTGYILTYPGRDHMAWLRERPLLFAFLLVVALMMKWKEGSEAYWRITPLIRGKLPKLKSRKKLQQVVGELRRAGYLKAKEEGRDLLVSPTDKCPLSLCGEPGDTKYVPIERSDAQIISMLKEPTRFCLWYHVRATGCKWDGVTCTKQLGRESTPGLSEDQYRTAFKKCKGIGLFDSTEVLPGICTEVVCSATVCYSDDDRQTARDVKIIRYAGDSKRGELESVFDDDIQPLENTDEKPTVKPDEKPSENPHVIRKKCHKQENSKNVTSKKETPTPLTPQEKGRDGDFFLSETGSNPGGHNDDSNVDAAESALRLFLQSPEYTTPITELKRMEQAVAECEAELQGCQDAAAKAVSDCSTEPCARCSAKIQELLSEIDGNPEKMQEVLESQDVGLAMYGLGSFSEWDRNFCPDVQQAESETAMAKEKVSDAIIAREAYEESEEYCNAIATEERLLQGVERAKICSRNPETVMAEVDQKQHIEVEDVLVLVPCLWELWDWVPCDPYADTNVDTGKILHEICSVYNNRMRKGEIRIHWDNEKRLWEDTIATLKEIPRPSDDYVDWSYQMGLYVSGHAEVGRYSFDRKARTMLVRAAEKLAEFEVMEETAYEFTEDEIQAAKDESDRLWDKFERALIPSR